MAVFRIEKTCDYTVMSNHHLRNAGLSLKSKGLSSIMLPLQGGLKLHHQGSGKNLQGGHRQHWISPEGTGSGECIVCNQLQNNIAPSDRGESVRILKNIFELLV